MSCLLSRMRGLIVMAGLPRPSPFCCGREPETWMPGTTPGMTSSDTVVDSLSIRPSGVLLARHYGAEQVPALALEAHHLQLLERGEIGRAGLDPGARQIDADLEIQIGRLLHD